MSLEQPRDRRRIVLSRSHRVNFVNLGPSFEPPFEQVTSVSVVPFMSDGRLVVALLDRGPDLPGGHVREDERTLEETARREAFEEASITLADLVVAEVIQSDYFGSSPAELTYLVTLTGLVDELLAFRPSLESHGRLLLRVDDFLERYQAGDRDQMHLLVEAARTVLATR